MNVVAMQYPERLQSLKNRLAAQPAQALLLTHLPDIRYLCGFTGSNALLLLLPRRTVLFTDGRYSEQARKESADSGVRVVITKHLVEEACKTLLRAKATSAAFDSTYTSVAALARMQAHLPESMSKAAKNRFFIPLGGSPVAPLRQVKDPGELARIGAAAHLGCSLFEAILPYLKPGTPEREIAARLEFEARQRGAEAMSFNTIVASGKRSALPHGHAGSQPLPRRGFVTLDFGIILEGYCSDMTRTVYLGKPTREEREAYQAVLAAEQAGIAAVKPGVSGKSVDRAARGLLRKRGLEKYFSHSTGHGVGLEIHEGPRLSSTSDDLLAENMVVTVEPGIYIPERFGVRIEDMVVVQADKAKVLTPAPKELLTL